MAGNPLAHCTTVCHRRRAYCDSAVSHPGAASRQAPVRVGMVPRRGIAMVSDLVPGRQDAGALRRGAGDDELVVRAQRACLLDDATRARCGLLPGAESARQADLLVQSLVDRVLGAGAVLRPGRCTPFDRGPRADLADK